VRKRHAVMFNQVQAYREETLHLIEDVTEAMADQIPSGFRNNIRWNLGHIYLDQYLWIQHLTKETIPMPDGFREWFSYGTSPADWKTNPPSMEVLKELLRGQPEQIRAVYGERLDEEFPATEMGMHTIEQVLVRTIFHEGMHIEAIKAIRRFL